MEWKEQPVHYSVCEVVETGANRGFRIAVERGDKEINVRVMVSGRLGEPNLIVSTFDFKHEVLRDLLEFIKFLAVKSGTKTVTIENYKQVEKKFIVKRGFVRNAMDNLVYTVTKTI